jgi:hypothetical protein
MRDASRREVFEAIAAAAHTAAGTGIRLTTFATAPVVKKPDAAISVKPDSTAPPHLTEAWYCCAEPGPDIANYV